MIKSGRRPFKVPSLWKGAEVGAACSPPVSPHSLLLSPVEGGTASEPLLDKGLS